MRYLTLIAEYTQSALRGDYLGPVTPEEVGLPWALGDRIRDWNERYRAAIPLDPEQRAERAIADLIVSLDAEGLELVSEIVSELRDVKVRYYSEGRLRYLQ